MILSTKGRYGLRAMFVLAQNYGDGPTSLSQIAERESISVNYLEQLFLPLRRGELIKSVRGAQGGYLLNAHPNEITIGKVLKTLEGPIRAADCLDEDSDCSFIDACVTRNIWEKITDSVDEVIESITLQDMLDENEAMIKERSKIKTKDIVEA